METLDASKIWRTTCKELSTTLSKDVYDRWIAVIEANEVRDDELVLHVANDFYQTWLVENYLSLIQNAVSAAAGKDLRIAFAVDRTHKSALSTTSEPPRRKVQRKRKDAERPSLNQNYTFDRFVVGPSNSFAHAASLAVAQSPARAYNPLFIYGGVGLGKTHLMQGIGHHALGHHESSVCYISSEAFTNDYIDALQRKALVEFRRKYRNVDILLIDDIHFLGGKERLQEEFFHTFNALFDNHKQIVMTCDCPASEIPGLEQRLVSRFEWGLVTELETPDIETRIAILRKKQEQLKISLPDEVLGFLAERIRSNIRRLEGALIRTATYASLTENPLTVENLEYLLRDTLDQESKDAVTMETIQKTVAEYYDIRMGDMTSKRRPQSIAFPRQMAMYLCRDMTQHSLPEIGCAFGRNHATVLHACRLIERRCSEDSALRQTVATLRQRLGRH